MAILHFRAGCLALAMLLTLSSLAQAESVIVSRAEAARHGLNRAWYTQIHLDRASGGIEQITHAGETLFVLTRQGVVQSIDANTGQTHWAVQVGRATHPSLGPAANDKYVALTNGSRVYLLERATGRQVWDRQVADAPGAAPALTATHVFVPMLSGRVEGYSLEGGVHSKWIYASDGRAMVQPTTTATSICWATDKGNVYVAATEKDNLAVRFRVETSDTISTSASYAEPYLFAASLDGYVYAVHEQTGNQRWRFSVGDPIIEPPVAVGDRLYVCADRGGMYCLSTADAKVHWWSPRPMRFVAAGENQIYAQDRHGNLLVLDATSGTLQGSMTLPQRTRMVTNSVTDRIYLVSETGLLQCLHDASLVTPLKHQQAAVEKAAPAAPQQKPSEEPAQPADDDDNPFGGGGGNAPAANDNQPDDDAGSDNPFGGNPFGGGNAPANDADAGSDNPFGGDPFGGDNPFN